MKEANTFGMFLYNTREEFGLTKKDLSKELNVSIRTITYWENDYDDRKPALPYLFKLSRLFNIPIDDMLF